MKGLFNSIYFHFFFWKYIKKLSLILLLLIAVIMMSHCEIPREPITHQEEQLKITKYSGHKIIKKLYENNDKGKSSDRDWYLIRNDTIAIELRVPKWFSDLYSVGNTIK